MLLGSRICKSITEEGDNILITSLLEESSGPSWYARPKTPVPNEEWQATIAIQARLVTSIMSNNEDYLGRIGFTMVRQELADIFLFPVPNKRGKVFRAVVARPYYTDELVAKVTSFLAGD